MHSLAGAGRPMAVQSRASPLRPEQAVPMTDPALNARYSAFVRAGWPAAAALPPQHARDALYGAVLAWRAGERAAAQTWAAFLVAKATANRA